MSFISLSVTGSDLKEVECRERKKKKKLGYSFDASKSYNPDSEEAVRIVASGSNKQISTY